MAKKQQPQVSVADELDDWKESADRINRICAATEDPVEVNATAPKLKPDGSLKDEAQAAEDADVRRVANEFCIDEEVLRNEYHNDLDD